jgi:hypothetical protein
MILHAMGSKFSRASRAGDVFGIGSASARGRRRREWRKRDFMIFAWRLCGVQKFQIGEPVAVIEACLEKVAAEKISGSGEEMCEFMLLLQQQAASSSKAEVWFSAAWSPDNSNFVVTTPSNASKKIQE